jgi:hypothetical protein
LKQVSLHGANSLETLITEVHFRGIQGTGSLRLGYVTTLLNGPNSFGSPPWYLSEEEDESPSNYLTARRTTTSIFQICDVEECSTVVSTYDGNPRVSMAEYVDKPETKVDHQLGFNISQEREGLADFW